MHNLFTPTGSDAPKSHLFNNRPVIRQRLLTILLSVLSAALLFSSQLFAGEADVVGDSITSLGDGRYRVKATVKHADSGWDHYANRWDVLAPDGSVLGVRELLHPHENEQPFTRSLTLEIPAGIKVVTLRANDSVHGLGGVTFQLTVPQP